MTGKGGNDKGKEAISSIIFRMSTQYYVYIMTNKRNTVL